MNFGDATIANNLIEHFEKQGGILERVGCCSAPHHGSHYGFATDRIPSQFKGAVCLISCDPDRTGFGHPRIEAVISILKGGMLPNPSIRSGTNDFPRSPSLAVARPLVPECTSLMTIVASLAETNYQYSVSIRNTDCQLPGPV